MFTLSSQLLRILLFGLLCLFILVSYVVDAPAQWQSGGWGDLIQKGMQVYLICLFIRTIFYLNFSFLEFLNRTDLKISEKFPLVTIVIPGFNEGLVIEKSIESTTRVQYPNLEILVVDDGSTDDMFSKALDCSKKYQNVRVITKPNGGKADALNWGIREAYGEYVLCMDADTQLQNDVLLVSVPFLESNPNIAAVAGNVIIGNSNSNLLTRFQQLEYIIGLNFYKSAQSYLGLVNIVPGPAGLFRRSAILDVGGYSVDTFAEDCDLTLRLLTNGYIVKYCPAMKAFTEAPEQINELLTQRYRWNRGIIQAIVKNAGWLFLPRSNFRNRILLLQTIGDSILIPLINYIFAMSTLFFVLLFGQTGLSIFGPFFVGLVCLDIVLTLFSTYTEGHMGQMAILTVINRMTYGLALEVLRFYALLDELLGIPMKWGVLKRKGLS